MKFPYPVGHDIPVILAPMAGVSESPFRRICREWGADVVVTEFLSAEGIRRENAATLDKLGSGRTSGRSASRSSAPSLTRCMTRPGW
jgi:tRNA-dihydrouridine synthase